MIKVKNNVIVADTWQLKKFFKKKINFISVFEEPQKTPKISNFNLYNNLRNRDEILSEFYDGVLPNLVKSHFRVLNYYQSYSDLSIRQVLVTLSSVYIDRSLKLISILQKKDLDTISIGKIHKLPTFIRNDDIRNVMSYSWTFNQNLINFLIKCCGVKTNINLKSKDFEKSYDIKINNLLFSPPSENFFNTIIIRIKNYVSYILRKYSKKKLKFLSLGFSGDDYYLGLKGFYGPFGIFSGLDNNFKLKEKKINKKIRRIFYKEIEPIFHKKLEKIFRELSSKKNSHLCKIFSKNFSLWFANNFPINFLEGFKENIDYSNKYITNNFHQIIIGTDMIRDEDLFLGMALKSKGGKIVGIQHGGYYGYVESLANICETEYAFYDFFLTWGWKEFDNSMPFSKAISLPSIRLSEKPINFKNKIKMFEVNEKLKILFMSSHIWRFSHLSTCGAPRSEFAFFILQLRLNMLKNLISSNFFVAHKPYNYINLEYSEKFKEFKNLLINKNYLLLKLNQKGLSSTLLKDYNIVLWDQLGSGALDCFSNKIPTMILWKRIFSKESKFAETYINELEKCGIVHKNVNSLILELKKYKKNPKKWFETKKRVMAIKTFCYNYARTDKNWQKIWKERLCQISTSLNI